MPIEGIRSPDNKKLRCSACPSLFSSTDALRKHERKNRCKVAYPRPKRKRTDQRKDQQIGAYNDPWNGRISLSRGENGRFECLYCGTGVTRVDRMADHVRYQCKARRGSLASPTTGTPPTNKNFDSTLSSIIQPDHVNTAQISEGGLDEVVTKSLELTSLALSYSVNILEADLTVTAEIQTPFLHVVCPKTLTEF